MIIAVPKEIESNESRVSTTPQSAAELIKAGYEVKCMEMSNTDILLHDGYTWHYSGPNQEKGYTRRGISVRFIIERAVNDLPLPDSPTIPNISFGFSLKEILDKILCLSILTVKFFTDRRGVVFIWSIRFFKHI